MEVIRDIANGVDDMIKFTVDVPSNYSSNKMPVLDLQVWLDENNRVRYTFYEKPMKSNMVIDKSSALPYSMKMKALTQETFRRIHNTDEEYFKEHKGEILSKYMQKLRNSGYSELERYNILLGGFKIHEKINDLVEKGKRN